MKLFLAAFLLLMNTAFAIDCAPLNLITEKNSPFQKIPVYDQDGIGICYAYTAATLIDYYRIKNGAQSRTAHPTWIALNHSIKSNKAKISSGFTVNAINELRAGENCPYPVVDNAIGTWAKKANVTDSEIVSVLEKYAPKYEMLVERKKAMAALESKAFEITRHEITIILEEALNEQIEFQCSSNPTWDQIVPELHALSIMGSTKLFESLIFPACQLSKQKLSIPQAGVYSPNSTGEYPELLDDLLNIHSAPLSVSYCSSFLYNKNYAGVVSRSQNGDKVKDDCKAHESVLVGKKKVGDTCNFLLRNSWGSGFADWTNQWKCLCKHKKTGEFVDDCTSATHNNGQYTVEGCWVDENSLVQNIYQATVLGAQIP